jgi:hypothetical protein
MELEKAWTESWCRVLESTQASERERERERERGREGEARVRIFDIYIDQYSVQISKLITYSK